MEIAFFLGFAAAALIGFLLGRFTRPVRIRLRLPD
jgi:hypothetical protein